MGLCSITPKNQGKHSFRNFFVGNDRGQRLWCVNLVLFTNTKLFKIGYISEDKCSFCNSEPEAVQHLLFHWSLVQPFRKDFEYFFFLLTREFVHLTLQDFMIGIIYANYPLVNCLILVAKSYIWDCRRNLSPPVINAFKLKAKIKHETEKIIILYVNTNNMDKFNKKWDLCMGSEPIKPVICF